MLVLDADQIGRLLAAANPEWRTFFLAAATTGDGGRGARCRRRRVRKPEDPQVVGARFEAVAALEGGPRAPSHPFGSPGFDQLPPEAGAQVRILPEGTLTRSFDSADCPRSTGNRGAGRGVQMA